MKKCKLCKLNDADKKGSHIVPHFLLKRIENIEGKTGRDYELGFSISNSDTRSYFGRSIQPEKLEETFGEITDEDIDKNTHPLIVDNIFCCDCEKRFAMIEDEYAKTIKTKGENIYESGISSIKGVLFWASIIWRMSINGKSGVKLSEKRNEKLREILDNNLSNEPDEVGNKDVYKNNSFISLTYKILRYENTNNNQDKWLFLHPDFNNPLCLLIDEYIICFSFNKDFPDLNNTDCLGLNQILNSAPNNNISSNSNEIIKAFDESIYMKINNRLVEMAADEKLRYLNELLNIIHCKAGGNGNQMPKEIKQEILLEITFEEKKIGRKYTLEDISKSIYKVMTKYML